MIFDMVVNILFLKESLVNREKFLPIIRKQISSLQSGDHTYLDLRKRTVGMRQQIQHSNHTEITIKNPQNHNKFSLVYNKSYTPYRPQHPLRKRGHQ